MILVPHVFRQEVVGGQQHNRDFMEHDRPSMFQVGNNAVAAINSSPINFFDPNRKKYPFWDKVDKQYVDLRAGACLFIPAFHYY